MNFWHKYYSDRFQDPSNEIILDHRPICLARLRNLYGVFQLCNGEIICDFIYEEARFWLSGLIALKRREHWIFVGPTGKKFAKQVYSDFRQFSKTIAVYNGNNGKWGLRDLETGEILRQCMFDDIREQPDKKIIEGHKKENWIKIYSN